MATISEALAIAIGHHQAMRLAVAEQIHRNILAAEPNHADALHLLGVLAQQMGKQQLAIEYITRAIRLCPAAPVFHNNLAEVFRTAGKLPEAIACCRRALELRPDYVEAYNNLGNAFRTQGKPEEAVACYRRALALKPDYAEAHSNLGNALQDQGKLDEAVVCFRRALELNPACVEAYGNLGNVARDRGKLDEAVAYYRQALALRPAFAEVFNNLGSVLQIQGKLDEAVACFRRALELMPHSAEVHANLGNALQEQEKLDEAVACHRRALELRPDHAAAHNNLGNALREQGKTDEAAACYRRALELKPDYAEAHNNLGVVFQNQGKPDEAVACYRRALELKPDYAEVYNNLGMAFQEQQRLNEAVASYQQAIQLKPDYADAYNNLGSALKDQGKLDETVACCRRFLELQPDSAEAHNNLGGALKDQGKLDEAVACCRRALELKPDYTDAYINLGIALKDQGKLDEAVACYRQVTRLEPGGVPGESADGRESVRRQAGARTRPPHAQRQDSLGTAFGELASVLQDRLSEEDLLAMRRLLSAPNLGGDGRIVLQYGLAQVLNARGDYAAAAEHFGEANAARLAAWKGQERDYSPAAHRSSVGRVLATFTPRFFARVSGFGLETELPVFIVGLPRSGTTLVEQILASHSLVFGAGELHYCEETFQSLPKAMNRSDAPLDCLLDLDRETARRLAQRQVDRLRALDERAVRIVDKMPENYQFLGLIRVLFPQARIIHCRRDLRDVALSCWMTNLRSVSWACHPDYIVSHFEEYSRLTEHWRRVLPSPPLDIAYEELVEDLEGVARRIIEWCGLEWEPGCLRFYETQRPVRTASAVQVRRPIYKSSVGRWKHYEKPLGEFFSRVHRLDGF